MTDLLALPQLPGNGQIFLDHVGWFVHDMAAVETRFAELGFPLTPFSRHGDRNLVTGELILTGTANRLAMLERGYLEFLVRTPEGTSPAADHLEACLARHEGVHVIAFAIADAEAERARLTDAGVSVMPVVNLRRTIERADGNEGEVAFTLNRAALDAFPEGRIQSLVHHTPDDMWQDRYVAKDNGVRALSEVWFVADDAAASAGRLARFTGRSVTEAHIHSRPGYEVALDRGTLRFMSNAAAAEALANTLVPAAATVAAIAFTGDPDRFFHVAEKARIDAHRLPDGSTVIPAAVALGAALVVKPE